MDKTDIKNRLRRTRIYVPGNNPSMVQNAGIYGPDSIIFDLEDSVSIYEKNAARDLVSSALKSVDYGSCELTVRVNAIDTPFFEDDIKAIVPSRPDAIVLPKAEDAEGVKKADAIITKVEREYGIPDGSIKLMPILESAKGIINAVEIATASDRIVGISPGGEDLTADLGATRTKDGRSIFYAQSKLITAAAYAKIQIWDTVFADVNDPEGLYEATKRGIELGFDGKAVIHPNQIEVVHRAFLPSESEINRAERIMAAYEDAMAKGSGVVAVDGRMIDVPVIKRTKKILTRAEAGLHIKGERKKELPEFVKKHTRVKTVRKLPSTMFGKPVRHYKGPNKTPAEGNLRVPRKRDGNPNKSKVSYDFKQAIIDSGLKTGDCITFHHHFRGGDKLVNRVFDILKEMGIKDIDLAPSSIHPCNNYLVEKGYIDDGTIRRIQCGTTGKVGVEISRGKLKDGLCVRSHGGRARAIEAGDIDVKVAFIAAPSSDKEGNLNGVIGPQACGSLGYAFPDAQFAEYIIAVTNNIVPYPNYPISIPQTFVDAVVVLPKDQIIGDPKGIATGTLKITRDPMRLKIARSCLDVIVASGLLKEGIAYQSGAGGISLAVTHFVRNYMKEHEIKGSFGMGGATGELTAMLEEGLFQRVLDVQTFDQTAIKSLRENHNHVEIGSSHYANPHTAGPAVDQLDVVILGATEVDVDFNVNVVTESSGVIAHGIGGHQDTASAAKLSIIAVPCFRGRIPTIVDNVIAICTPGDVIDVVVTERGIAVNPKSPYYDTLQKSDLIIRSIENLRDEALALTEWNPEPIDWDDKIVAYIEYRDGTLLDVIRKVKNL